MRAQGVQHELTSADGIPGQSYWHHCLPSFGTALLRSVRMRPAPTAMIPFHVAIRVRAARTAFREHSLFVHELTLGAPGVLFVESCGARRHRGPTPAGLLPMLHCEGEDFTYGTYEWLCEEKRRTKCLMQ